jgi:subtilisin family serine protease
MRKNSSTGLRLLVLLFISVFLTITFVNTLWAGNGNTGHVADELLIKAKAGVSKGKIAGILQGIGAGTVGEIPALRVKQIRVPAHALEKVKTALSHNPNISYVEYNFIAEASLTPNDPNYPSQWHHPKISASQGWDISTGSNSVPIAIIDSGADPNHPDLSSKLVPGYNFLEENTRTRDIHGHGTKVAGTAAAISNNFIGVASVAWDNPIMPLVVVDKTGWATYYDISRAITYAADNGVKVMNISIAGSSPSYTLQNAVNYAWNNGAVIVAGAGNSSTSAPYYPAACDNVVAVSATDSGDNRAWFSNYGDWVDISAPGVSIWTTIKGGGYGSPNGTSFSSPLSAGLAALIMSANPSLTNTQVVEIINQNTDDIGAPGFDPYFGFGRINVYKSLVAATGTVPEPDTIPPSATITSPTDGSTVTGSITVSVSATDNVGVSEVELYIDGALHATDYTEPYDFLWDTTIYSDGAHELVAIAYDTSANAGQSDPVTVYVSNPTQEDSIAPTVSILSPVNGATVRPNENIKVTASDNVGINRVEFFIDGVLKSVEYGTSDMYRWKWDTRKEPNGAHSISIDAYDDAGNVGTDAISVYK